MVDHVHWVGEEVIRKSMETEGMVIQGEEWYIREDGLSILIIELSVMFFRGGMRLRCMTS